MQNLKFAFSSIMAHKMRSLLTMIGIIIGVSSVVVIMALGDSLSRQVNKDMTKSQKNISVHVSSVSTCQISILNLFILIGQDGIR
ncbi:ABC transporter permeae [Streptococcus pneumoniae]|nr:ABC transporter permeae [Streptococcus pneumoniae]